MDFKDYNVFDLKNMIKTNGGYNYGNEIISPIIEDIRTKEKIENIKRIEKQIEELDKMYLKKNKDINKKIGKEVDLYEFIKNNEKKYIIGNFTYFYILMLEDENNIILYNGKTINYNDRINTHKRNLKNNKHHNKELQGYYNKLKNPKINFYLIYISTIKNNEEVIKIENEIRMNLIKKFHNDNYKDKSITVINSK